MRCMNTVLIKTFLTVMATGNISKAATHLYVSQSTVSARIKQLEDEVGAELFSRARGNHDVKLTAKGSEFVAIARRYTELNDEISKFVTGRNEYAITVACADSLNTYVLRPFYEEMVRNERDMRLTVKTHQSYEIYTLIEEHVADIGFVFFPARSKDIVTEKVFSEKMVLVLSRDGGWPERALKPSELDPSYEISCNWSDEILRWHDNQWGADVKPFVKFNTAQAASTFFIEPQCFMICPVSVARELKKSGNVVIRECASPIPDRVAYIVSKKRMPENVNMTVFKQKLLMYLNSFDFTEIN